MFLCKRPGYYHITSKTRVRDRIFKNEPNSCFSDLSIRFPEFTELNESSAPFRKNSIDTHKQIDFSICDVKSNVPGMSIIQLPPV